MSLESRLRQLEERAATELDYPEKDKSALLDLVERQEYAATLIGVSERASYRRYCALVELRVDHRVLEERLDEEPGFLTPYLHSVDAFWEALAAFGNSAETRRAFRAFIRARTSLLEAIE
jgi:hypothetical protein